MKKCTECNKEVNEEIEVKYQLCQECIKEILLNALIEITRKDIEDKMKKYNADMSKFMHLSNYNVLKYNQNLNIKRYFEEKE